MAALGPDNPDMSQTVPRGRWYFLRPASNLDMSAQEHAGMFDLAEMGSNPQDKNGGKTPKEIEASITNGTLHIFGMGIPLPIRCSLFLSLLFHRQHWINPLQKCAFPSSWL